MIIERILVEKTEELKPAADAQRPISMEKGKRKYSQESDSGYSSNSGTPPRLPSCTEGEGIRIRKRVRIPDDEEKAETPKPASLTKQSYITRSERKSATIPRATPAKRPVQVSRPRTRGEMTKTKSNHKLVGDSDEDDFVVDDTSYKPRKSKVGAMVRSNLFSGMR